jgi:chromosome segregation ATPase
MRNESDTEPAPQYLFIVARNRPDILERVKERLRGDGRIDVITDRRRGERRAVREARTPERRRGDRRRPTRHWDDLTVYPTLVVQKRVESYAELQQKAAAAARQTDELRAENDRLYVEIASLQNRMHGLETREGSVRADNERLRGELAALQQRLHALAAADATFKADASAILGQAEAAVGALIARFEALTRERGIEIPSSPRG